MLRPILGTVLVAAVLSMLPAPWATAEELTYRVSWVGNSFSGRNDWVLQDVDDICVLPDGTLFTNVPWDESGGNVQEYREGKLVAVAGHTHGWGYEGGSAVAANSRYLFIAEAVDNEGGGLKGDSWPAKGFTWAGISRRLRSDIRQPAPFEGGHGKEGDVLQRAFLPMATLPAGREREGAIRGLCATENRLYVSSPFDNAIVVIDAESMRTLHTWSVMRPDKICLDRAGRLWVLQRPESAGGAWRALCCDAEGKRQTPAIVFPAGMIPSALCVDGRGRLLVADSGPDQQIKIYEGLTATPKPVGTFGVKGGIFASPAGAFEDRRFNQPKGIGVDASGNIYVASSGSTAGGSTVLECYTPNGRISTRRMGLTFVDIADVDPASPSNVYIKDKHFSLTPMGEGSLPWDYKGYTVNRFKYPDDPRLHTPGAIVWVRTLQGKKILFVTGMTADYLSVYRFQPATDGEIAIPCGLFAKKHASDMEGYPPHQPERGEWMWLDRNGNGAIDAGEYQTGEGESQGILYPDERGTIWQANGDTIRELPLAGMTPQGAPLWDYRQARRYPKPADLDEVRRLHYLPDRDIMLLGGNRGEDHNQHWKPMGPVLCLYEGWRSASPRLKQRVVLPYEKGASGHESAEPISFSVAGDYVFVAYTRGIPASGVKNAFVRVLRLSDLSFAGNLSAEATLGETGLLDLVESVSATRRPDGEYLVFLEDDYRSKVVLFHWRPQ